MNFFTNFNFLKSYFCVSDVETINANHENNLRDVSGAAIKINTLKFIRSTLDRDKALITVNV